MSRVQTCLKTLPWLEKVGCFKGRTFAEGSNADAGFRRFQVVSEGFRGFQVVSEGIKHVKHLKLFSTTDADLVWDFSQDFCSDVERSHPSKPPP